MSRYQDSAKRGTFATGDLIAAGVICAVAAAFYLMLPRQGDIWWMDASRHALNGAFLLDFFRTLPVKHPMEFAIGYYRQWPALTIGFYPPLFYVPLALSYAIFGVSEASALVAELAFLAVLGWGAYRLSRHWLDTGPALAVAVLMMGGPELRYWGQQVMLDVPAYAFLIWAIEFQVRYMKKGAQASLYAAVICAVLAVYTKYNAVFIFAVMAVGLVYARGLRFAWSGAALRAYALGLVLMIPLLVWFTKFSTYNIGQAASGIQGHGARWSFEQLTYYARIMGSVVSWPTMALAAAYVLILPFFNRLKLPKEDAVLLLAWVIIGYVFYAMIAIKEPRHILFITYPIVLASVLLLTRLWENQAWRVAAPLALACVVVLMGLKAKPAPYVTGMRQAAQEVARLSPKNSNVAFWGRLDGTFIFAMRAYTGRDDLGVVRLDKLLLRGVAVGLDRGFKETNYSAQDIAAKLRALHVQYIVLQTHYGQEIGSIQRLTEALHSSDFREVNRIPMTSNYPFPYLDDLVIYRATADVPAGRVAPSIEVKLLNRSF